MRNTTYVRSNYVHTFNVYMQMWYLMYCIAIKIVALYLLRWRDVNMACKIMSGNEIKVSRSTEFQKRSSGETVSCT